MNVPFTYSRPFEEASQDAWAKYYGETDNRWVIRCDEPTRRAQLAMKMEEYTRRAQSSVNKEVVRDAISKMAIIDKLLGSEFDAVDVVDGLDYAKEGLIAYGMNLLIESEAESEAFVEEFCRAFHTVRSYVLHGNEFMVGGTQLLEAI